jgi:hypothetical protein
MIESLENGDIDAAASMISPPTRSRYREIFLFTQEQLPSFVSQLGTLENGSLIGSNIVEYILVRNTSRGFRGFEVYFVRGLDGVWRIEGM